MSQVLRTFLGASLAIGISCTTTAAERFEFVVLGDIPYGEDQVQSLAFIGSRIRGEYPFVIHYGDLKAGNGACSDGELQARHAQLTGLIPGGLFYTPGDNDWTDCDRPSTGDVRDELERLAFLRQLFFSEPPSSASPWSVSRQRPAYPENARWAAGGLIFATVHVVGSDNGRAEILESDVATALDAVDARDRANLDWLDQAFDAAASSAALGLVVAMQADPYEIGDPKAREVACSPEERTRCNPYLGLLTRLTERAAALDKPVLLVHGSTTSYCMDRGFGGWRAPRLWRLNGPGDFVAIDAAVVTFDPDAREPFAARGVLTGDPPVDCAPWRR